MCFKQNVIHQYGLHNLAIISNETWQNRSTFPFDFTFLSININSGRARHLFRVYDLCYCLAYRSANSFNVSGWYITLVFLFSCETCKTKEFRNSKHGMNHSNLKTYHVFNVNTPYCTKPHTENIYHIGHANILYWPINKMNIFTSRVILIDPLLCEINISIVLFVIFEKRRKRNLNSRP